MVTLHDVLKLPSCGFSSVPKIMRAEILRGLTRITDNSTTIDKDRLEKIVFNLSGKIRQAKISKEDFVRRKQVWLEAQILLVRHNFYFILFKIFKLFPRKCLTKKLTPWGSVAVRLASHPSPAVTTTKVACIMA